ncbi:NlpC/P60 family protein [Microbispora sp. NPDC088329]|uniref:NlpC/P60 family protein n=1 Tax=Microbispora sp. NPDC088329 TaxID=3154869 RepID=UPI00341B1FD0
MRPRTEVTTGGVRHGRRRSVLAVSFAALALGGTMSAASPASAAGSRLGGVDMQRACDNQYPGKGLRAVVLDRADAYSWTCSGGTFRGGIEITTECAAEYGQGAYAGLGNRRDPFSWYCQGWETTARMRAAVNWAVAELRSPDPTMSDHWGKPWSGYCERFVEQAGGFKYHFGSANEHYQWHRSRGLIHSDARPPAGAVVFYDGGRGDGHVGISLGNGQVISTQGYGGQRLPVWRHSVTGLTNHYLGWAYPIGA